MALAHFRYRVSRSLRRGIGLIYGMIAMVTLCGIVSLSADYGRVQLVKTELSATAEAAARSGAAGLATNWTTAQQNAIWTASTNTADGQPVTLYPGTDVEIGTWDSAAQSFSVGGATPNAVRVTARRTAIRGNAVKLPFAGIVGKSSCDITCVAVAIYSTLPQPSSVTNKSNPWLAGMPNGTTANAFDSAPTASPSMIMSGGMLQGGSTLTFDVTGQTSNQAGVEAAYPPDGNLNWIIHNYSGNEHGIADLTAPISALVGVFLDDNQPDKTAAPNSLDFTTATSRDFSTLSPKLKQPFFIGDGRRANGAVQQFIVPNGATRLFVGSMDGQQWSDNAGGFNVTVKQGTTTYHIETVQ